ncbi:hypothetical protein [Myxococcus sp. RHSTA-1-4]|uniref:hypothetical protein n=1 Tax=Myxococcus sp. RHSTA-1-4 TaxID=2874601 RepID=UPI001CC130B9|nr:hypothetical protein [Myxococcus sp. RHSTA-1-4]
MGSVADEGEGVIAWSRSRVLGDSEAPHMVVAPDGDVLVAATYREPVDIGGGPLPFNRFSRTPRLLVARFSPDGALRWAHPVETPYPRAQDGSLLRLRP